MKLYAVTESSPGLSTISSFLVDISLLVKNPSFSASDYNDRRDKVCRKMATNVLQNIMFCHSYEMYP
jgi:hypothetical protein